jgi:lysophospholipase L1-like esterase
MTALFRYVALGDSTAVGVGAASGGGYPERLYQRLKGAGAPAGILNLARSGATSSDVLSGQVQKAASAKAALITLGVGTNDLWRMVPTATFAANLERIASALEPSGARIVVSTLIDLRLAPVAAFVQRVVGVPLEVVGRRVDEFNRVIAALASRPGFDVVDLFALSHREKGRIAELFSADGFHPSAQGYEAWTEVLWPHVHPVAERWRQDGGDAAKEPPRSP